MVLAMSTGSAVLGVIGVVLGVVVLVLVVNLLQAILRPAMEIERYAADILTGGVGIATNLDGAPRLARTRDLATAVPGLAVAYLKKLGAMR